MKKSLKVDYFQLVSHVDGLLNLPVPNIGKCLVNYLNEIADDI